MKKDQKLIIGLLTAVLTFSVFSNIANATTRNNLNSSNEPTPSATAQAVFLVSKAKNVTELTKIGRAHV